MDITEMVTGATNELLFAPDLGANIAIIDRLNANPDDIALALEAVAERIDSGEPNCVVLAIHLLDMLMKNVDAVPTIVGTVEYLDVLIEVARCPAPSSEIMKAKDEALDFIQFYGGRYSHSKQLAYAHALHALRSEGDTWMPPDAPKQQQATGRAEEPITSTNLYHKITQLRESLTLLDEILAQKDAGESDLLREEMTPQCKALHSSFINYLEEHGHELQENTFAQLLSLNDALSQSIQKADKAIAKATQRKKHTPRDSANPPTPARSSQPVPTPVVDLLDLSFTPSSAPSIVPSQSQSTTAVLSTPSSSTPTQPTVAHEAPSLLFDFPAPPPYTSHHQSLISSPNIGAGPSNGFGSALFPSPSSSASSSSNHPSFQHADDDDDPFAALATRVRPSSVNAESSSAKRAPSAQNSSASSNIGSLL